eukprot:6782112-Pyramimonas_sp.AAC.1
MATIPRDVATSQHSACASAVEGEGAEVLALLGLQSSQSSDRAVDAGVDDQRRAFPWPGGYEITWGPGTIHFDPVSAPSGDLCIPVGDHDKLEPRSWGLPPKQLTQLA